MRLIVILILIFTSCTKSKKPFEYPEKYGDQQADLENFTGLWIWHYSRIQSTSGPIFNGERTATFSSNKLLFKEDNRIYTYKIIATQNASSSVYVHCFNPVDESYEYTMLIELFSGHDSLTITNQDPPENIENAAVFSRD